MFGRVMQIALVGVVMAVMAGQVVAADTFYGSRQLARQQALEQGYYELRPWGGPTTGPTWWTPHYVRPGIHNRGPSNNVYNFYYFAPFSYPYIDNRFRFGY